MQFLTSLVLVIDLNRGLTNVGALRRNPFFGCTIESRPTEADHGDGGLVEVDVEPVTNCCPLS